MQVEKSQELKCLLPDFAQETTLGDKQYDCCRLKVMAQRHLEQKIKDSHFKARIRDEDRPAIGAPSKGKAKGQGQKQLRERRLHPSDHKQCSIAEGCAFNHESNKKGKAKPLYTKRGATSSNYFKKNLQNKKEKPESQVQILQFDKISEVF